MKYNKNSGSYGWKVVIVAAAAGIAVLLWWSASKTQQEKPSAPAVPAYKPPAEEKETEKDQPASMDTLIGQWVRPDGGYVIEIKSIGEGGKLDAAYFNPGPINVAEAKAEIKDGKLTVFIKLQDEGYPGSTYNLTYDKQQDALLGTYFQAVARQTYSIGFMRMEE